MVDVSKIRPGDVVHVRCVVGDRIRGRGVVQLRTCEPHPDYFEAVDDAIVHVEPREIKVGDRVRYGEGLQVWQLLCIDGSSAWLTRDGIYVSANRSDLTHAQDDTP